MTQGLCASSAPQHRLESTDCAAVKDLTWRLLSSSVLGSLFIVLEKKPGHNPSQKELHWGV